MSMTSNGFVLNIRTSTGPDVFTPIARVAKITPPKFVLNKETVRADGSGHAIVMPTTFEPFEVPLEILFDPVVPTAPAIAHDALRTRLLAKTIDVYQLILPDTGAFQWQFPAFVSSYEISELTQDGAPVMASITLSCTGAPTVTP
jgi:hypothetical protein